MSRFLDQRFEGLAPYTPGEQPRERKFIKLNTNELPYPPTERVVAAAKRAAGGLNLYSDPTNKAIIEAVAGVLGVEATRCFVSNGSDEVLALAFGGLCPKGVAYADQTYGFYPVFSQMYGLDEQVIPLGDDWTIDPTGYYGLGRTVVIANPNAPTGIALSLAEIEGIVQANPDDVVLIDEAYVDFGAESAVPLTGKYDNLLVVGTFSKSWGLAGGRLGYAVASAGLIDDLNRLKYSFNPYNVNSVTAAAGCAAIEDIAYYKDCRHKVVEAREWAAGALRALGFVCTDSRTNFLFCSHPRIEGRRIFARLREEGILVRRWDTPRIAEWLRISVGTMEEMQALVAVLRRMVREIQ